MMIEIKRTNRVTDNNLDINFSNKNHAIRKNEDLQIYQICWDDNLSEILSWCENSLSFRYGFTADNVWHFDNEEDKTQFSLRWIK